MANGAPVRALAVFGLLAASAVAAQGARLAVHPLELREMTAAQREVVQAQFDVMLARIADIRLAGSSAVEEALSKPAGKGCETRDECLRFFAESTESVYAVYARVRPDPLGAQLMINARVVRSDGAVIRKVALAEPRGPNVDLTESARRLLARALAELDLNKLSPTVMVEPVALLINPSFFEPSGVTTTSVRRPAGFAMLGIGAATLVAGSVMAVLAVDGRSKLTLDSTGAVPPSQASRALDVTRQEQLAMVMIPVGVVIAAVGGAMAWWPTDRSVTVVASAAGAQLQIGGRFP